MLMDSRSGSDFLVTPALVLRAYAAGIFPMADDADDPNLFWVEPEKRGIIPLDGLQISKSLAKRVRSERYTIRVDHHFDAVIEACAETGPDRERTWINGRIRSLFRALFAQGHAHTVECWREDRLVGGLYGLAIGGAFFGESMFHRESDASKVALVHLVARLKWGGFVLLDAQFITDHLASLGAHEISRRAYKSRLAKAISVEADFTHWPKDHPMSGLQALDAVRNEVAQRAGS